MIPVPPQFSHEILGLDGLCSYSDINTTALNIIIEHFGEDGLKKNPSIENHDGRYTPIIVGDVIKARG